VSEEAKAKVALDFFESIWVAPLSQARRVRLDWFDLPHAYLSDLCGHFSEDEVWLVIRVLPPDKAPGPDGSPHALQVAWPIIRAGSEIPQALGPLRNRGPLYSCST
jgi:hypothetical protein